MGILSRQLRCNFYEIFKNVLCINRYDNEAFSWFLELGSCALQVIHGAITAGHSSTKWTICAILSAAYYIFSKSPARTRWVEHVRVASKFLRLMSGIENYVNSPDLKNKALNSWRALEAGFKDPLLRAKICFFISVVKEVEPFLKRFQSTKPKVSFYIAVY